MKILEPSSGVHQRDYDPAYVVTEFADYELKYAGSSGATIGWMK